jgi:hypothetical protein
MKELVTAKLHLATGFVANAPLDMGDIKAPKIRYHFECLDADGNLKWEETVENLVTTAGRTDIVDKYLKGSAYTAAWFMGLKGAGTPAASDTLASTGAWSIVTPYSGNRPSITWGTTSSGSNTATAVSFSINATATVAGAFVCSVASGTSGVLYSVTDFAASRGVASGDTLNVTPTISVS